VELNTENPSTIFLEFMGTIFLELRYRTQGTIFLELRVNSPSATQRQN